MLGALDLLFALGRDDLRVVRYRCGRVRQDYPLLGHPVLTAHTYDRINLSQSSRCSQRLRLVIEEAFEKSLPF